MKWRPIVAAATTDAREQRFLFRHGYVRNQPTHDFRQARSSRALEGVELRSVSIESPTGRAATRGAPASRSRGRGGSTPLPRTPCSR